MYPDRSHFNVDQRRREKQKEREADCERLLKGRDEAAKLAQRNGLFSAFRADQMSIGRRRVRMELV